jgi:hypothetical protein
MRVPKLAVGVASVALTATPASRLAIAVGAAAATTGCEACWIGPLSPETLPDGQVGKAYFFQLDAPRGGSACSGHVEFRRVSGGLPPGMKLSEDGAIDGTPSLSGAYPFTVMATWDLSGEDTQPIDTAPKTYTLTILP